MALPTTEKTSRLLTNSVAIRKDLESRNLYQLENEYPLDPTTTTKIVNTISAIGSTLSPFRSQDLRNSAIGRLIVDKSPITEIGLQCLGKQLAYNTASRLEKEYLPTISIGNLFDKDPSTKLFTWKKDYSLTKNVFGSQKGIIGGIEKVLNVAEGIYPNKSPFQKDVTNDELIQNTGKAVLAIRDSNLKRNLYTSFFNKTSLNFNTIDLKSNKNYSFFNSSYNRLFLNNEITNTNMSVAYSEMIRFNSYGFEYGDYYFNNAIYGNSKNINIIYTNISGLDSINYIGISTEDTGSQSDISKNSWLFSNANTILQWDYNGIDLDLSNIDSINKYGNKGGLMEYTRNIMIASKGNYISINRKIFDHHDRNQRSTGTFGFNGSAVFEAPSTALPEFKNRRGVRQHTFKDPYDKFSKAIRFVGNKNYNDNKDSVIYETVLPRMHPIINSTDADNNKRLMFSIENLAFQVIAGDSGKGIIINSGSKDEIIPKTEIGAFGGRVMWFPPYDLGIVETADAKFTPTVFLGRNEPIYNYENSERSATITFKLIADYPPNLHDFEGKSSKEIIEFFTFGGKTSEPPKKEIVNKEIPPDKPVGKQSTELLYIFFPNNEPNTSNINSVFTEKKIYGLTNTDGTPNNYGVNKYIFNNSYTDIYTYSGLDDKINKILADSTNDDLSIQLIGHSTKLYYDSDVEKKYNKDLSERRCKAVEQLLRERIESTNFKNEFSFKPYRLQGSIGAPVETSYPPKLSTETDKEFNDRKMTVVNSELSVGWRYVEIHITKAEITKKVTTTGGKTTSSEIKTLPSESYYSKALLKDRSTIDIESTIEGMDSNYESIKDNYFMPVFHSQTPEDYHRRLTFLQQCTRQGAAQRTEQGGNNIRNSVFGRQPICILRIGDFFYTKIIINSINFSYKDAMWDLNPEGFGLQPIMCDVTMNIKIIGGQSLKGPIDLLQNAISFNYYANSTFTDKGIYSIPKKAESDQFEVKTTEIQSNTIIDKKNNTITLNYE